jgi:AraC-like DNA-binding protein
VKKRFNLDSVVGIGRPVPEGESLHASYRESVLALHLSVQMGTSVLFFEPEHAPQKALSFRDLKTAARELAQAFASDSMDPVKVAADRYVRLVLLYANERIEVVRSQFLVTVFELLESIQKQHVLRQAVVDQVATDLSQKLETAHSLYQLMARFEECLGQLWRFASQALEGPKSMRLTTTLQFLKDNFHEQLKLPEVARKAGFSVPAFSRVFRQATGTSFLAYVRSLRVNHAKRLLRTTSLSIEQVAQASGFQSQHHLIRSFKKVTHQTPGHYRREARATPGTQAAS